MIEPPRWTSQQFENSRQRAIKLFQEERRQEPLEAYLEAFEEHQGTVEDLLETTVDLTLVHEQSLAVLTDKKLQEAFRYLAGPPISEDDLKTLVDTVSLNAKRLEGDPDLVQRVIEVVLEGLDRRRFAWVSEEREATESERAAAVLATASLMATRYAATARRSQAKALQEQHVGNSLIEGGLVQVERRAVSILDEAPEPGTFCGESHLGPRKADFLVRLWDRRVMAIECKVSNSSTNSVKRLNNDVAAKADDWRRDFGHTQVVPCAVLSGVFKLRNLEQAQESGLTVFWTHELDPMVDWIAKTNKP